MQKNTLLHNKDKATNLFVFLILFQFFDLSGKATALRLTLRIVSAIAHRIFGWRIHKLDFVLDIEKTHKRNCKIKKKRGA